MHACIYYMTEEQKRPFLPISKPTIIRWSNIQYCTINKLYCSYLSSTIQNKLLTNWVKRTGYHYDMQYIRLFVYRMEENENCPSFKKLISQSIIYVSTFQGKVLNIVGWVEIYYLVAFSANDGNTYHIVQFYGGHNSFYDFADDTSARLNSPLLFIFS